MRYVHANSVRTKETRKEGVTLLLVVVLISGIFSVSLGVFTIIFNQIRTTGQLEASFYALYAADQATERLLRMDRTGVPLANGFNETNNIASGACYRLDLTKNPVNTFLNAVGTYPCTFTPPGGTIRRAFRLVYPTVGPPVLHWKLDEGSGITANDSSGNGNDGTLDGPLWRTQALSFNGLDSLVDAGSDATLDNLPAFTVSAWIYPKSAGEGDVGRIVQKGNGSNPAYGFRIALQPDTDVADTAVTVFTRIGYDGADLLRYTGANMITLNQWQHIVTTWNGLNNKENVQIYKNGVEVPNYGAGLSATGTKGDDNAENLWVGNINDKTRTFNGCIGPLKIWNRVLTPNEIRMDYESFIQTAGC